MSEIDAKVFLEWTCSAAIPKMVELKLIGYTDLEILVSGKDYILKVLSQSKECGNPKLL